MLEVAKTLLLRAWESIQSQKSVDEIKIQVTKLIQVYSSKKRDFSLPGRVVSVRSRVGNDTMWWSWINGETETYHDKVRWVRNLLFPRHFLDYISSVRTPPAMWVPPRRWSKIMRARRTSSNPECQYFVTQFGCESDHLADQTSLVFWSDPNDSRMAQYDARTFHFFSSPIVDGRDDAPSEKILTEFGAHPPPTQHNGCRCGLGYTFPRESKNNAQLGKFEIHTHFLTLSRTLPHFGKVTHTFPHGEKMWQSYTKVVC